MRVLTIFSKAKHIDIFAMGDNLNIANMAAAGFIMVNKCPTVHSCVMMQYLQATAAPKDHVAFFISRTGENRMLLDIAELMKLAGNPILVITASSHSKLAMLGNAVFPVATAEMLEELGPYVFLTGAKYVVDTLFAVLMTRDFSHVRQTKQWLDKHFYY